MDLCTNCGRKLYESNKFCINCGTRVATDNDNIPSTLRTRMEIKKNRLKKKRLLVGVGLITGLLLIISVTSIIVTGLNKPVTKSNLAASKTIDKSYDKAVEDKDQSSQKQQSTEEKGANLSSPDYILSLSDKQVMGEEDIANLTKQQLRLARNEIYARHGYVFKSQDLQEFFSTKSWYHQDPSYDGSLNKIEKENVAFLKAREDSL